MSKKKLVEVDKLKQFLFFLEMSNDKSFLIDFFNKYILEEKKMQTNDLKKMLYTLMNANKDKNEAKYKVYYGLYQDLKNGEMSNKECLEVLQSIN